MRAVNRWVLRLQSYRFTVRHIPGKDSIADPLSRHTSRKASANLSSEAEEFVRFVVERPTPQALSTREIDRASDRDKELPNVLKCVQMLVRNGLDVRDCAIIIRRGGGRKMSHAKRNITQYLPSQQGKLAWTPLQIFQKNMTKNMALEQLHSFLDKNSVNEKAPFPRVYASLVSAPRDNEQ